MKSIGLFWLKNQQIENKCEKCPYNSQEQPEQEKTIKKETKTLIFK